jgi:hypothetical protein
MSRLSDVDAATNAVASAPSPWIAAAPFFIAAMVLIVAALASDDIRESIETRANRERKRCGFDDDDDKMPSDVVGDWFEWGSDAVQALALVPVTVLGLLLALNAEVVSTLAVVLLGVSFLAGTLTFFALRRVNDVGNYLRWKWRFLTPLGVLGVIINLLFGFAVVLLG